MPCTQDSVYYDFPAEHPIIRFLDTRGLGEAGYDPDEDIEAYCKDSHAILVVLRIRDGEKHAVMRALAQPTMDISITTLGSAICSDQQCATHTPQESSASRRRRF